MRLQHASVSLRVELQQLRRPMNNQLMHPDSGSVGACFACGQT